MKLVEMLAREISVWPEGADYAIQSNLTKMVFFVWDTNSDDSFDFELSSKASDYVTAEVTRAQWEAERARIASQSVSMSDEDVEFVKSDFYREMVDRKIEQDLAAIACGKRSKEDQELWDKVAFWLYLERVKLNNIHDGDVDLFECAFSGADAFMAERAKRMKG